MCCISQILMAISYTDFSKSLYFKCTMNLKLDHHTYKVNFSKKILLVGLSSKNIFWMTRKKNPSHQEWWFLDFLLTNTHAFWLLHSYELALTEQSPLNLPKSRVHEASKKFSWPSRLLIWNKNAFFEFWVKKIAERGHYKSWKWSQIKSKLMSIGQKPQFFHIWSLYVQITFKIAQHTFTIESKSIRSRFQVPKKAKWCSLKYWKWSKIGQKLM